MATGGAGQNPLASYTYKDVGITLEMTPRVSPEGDILLDLMIDDSSQGASQTVAGTPNVPTFQQRTITTRLRLRDGESNLLAGLIQDNDSRNVTGFPGAIHVPFLSSALSGNTQQEDQTDIVMLLTPHIVRSSEVTEADLRPIYIGSQQTFSVGGQPPPACRRRPIETPSGGSGRVSPGITNAGGRPANTARHHHRAGRFAGSGNRRRTESASTGAGCAARPAAGCRTVWTRSRPPRRNWRPLPAPTASDPPVYVAGHGRRAGLLLAAGRVFPSRRRGAAYNIPISVTGATRLSTVTITVTFDPRFLRVRTIQEGSFLRSGGANVTFSQQASNGRIDITISRGADATGASGTGLLAAIMFDAIAPGVVTLSASGSATGPGNTPMGLQFRPVTLTVQ